MQAGLLVIVLFTLPETLFSRRDHTKLEKRSYTQKLLFHGKILDRKITFSDFIGSLRMARYAAVFFPAAWYMTANTYGSALFAVTGAHLASEVFGFELESIGLFMGIPLTVGNIIGECLAGWVSDFIINSYAKRHDGYRKPEARLYLVPLTTLLAIGTALYGYCIQTGRPWIDAAVVMAISGVGTQVGTTMVYTYTTDSYKPQSGEIGAVINLFKSGTASLQTIAFGKNSNLPQFSRSTLDSTRSHLAKVSDSMRLLQHWRQSILFCWCPSSSCFSKATRSENGKEIRKIIPTSSYNQAARQFRRRLFASRFDFFLAHVFRCFPDHRLMYSGVFIDDRFESPFSPFSCLLSAETPLFRPRWPSFELLA